MTGSWSQYDYGHVPLGISIMSSFELQAGKDELGLENDAARFAPANRRRLSGPALRTFQSIAAEWRLSPAEARPLLGSPARSTYTRWLRRATDHSALMLSVETLMRISHVLAIYRALCILFSDPADRRKWLRTGTDVRPFDGRSPLQLIAREGMSGLVSVRGFLDAALTGIYMPPGPADVNFEPYGDDEIIIR